MRNSHIRHALRKPAVPGLLGIALAVTLAACQPDPPAEPATPEPPPPGLGAAAPDSAPTPGEVAAPGRSAPATMGQEIMTGSPADASSAGAGDAPSATAALMTREPELSAMKLATPESSKLGVPVDLRYSLDGAVEPGRPVTVHLAAVPRVEGTNLNVSIKEDPGLQFAAAPFVAQKASSSTAYRQQLSVMKLATGPAELRVLITMQVGETSAFSWFGVPLTAEAAAPAAGK